MKKKKEKITYVDDGRSLADLSDVTGGMSFRGKGTSSRARDIWNTYWSATKMMVLPMLTVVGFLIAAFLIMALIFWLL